jgi:hypothetical protein
MAFCLGAAFTSSGGEQLATVVLLALLTHGSAALGTKRTVSNNSKKFNGLR